MFPWRSRALFNNMHHLADLMAHDMERQFARQWRRHLDHYARHAHGQRGRFRDYFEKSDQAHDHHRQQFRDHKEFDQARDHRQRFRDHSEGGQGRDHRQRSRDNVEESDQAREHHRQQFRDHKEFDQARDHRQRFSEFDHARDHRNHFGQGYGHRQRFWDAFEGFDHEISKGARESFKDMYKDMYKDMDMQMEMEIENQTPPKVGNDVYYKAVYRTEENGQVRVKTMEKEPGSEWKIVLEEFKKGEKPVEDAKLKIQEKVQDKVQEKIAEPNREKPETMNA